MAKQTPPVKPPVKPKTMIDQYGSSEDFLNVVLPDSENSPTLNQLYEESLLKKKRKGAK